ncbi:MAG: nucleotidyltransferase [Bacteroidetes bacterium SW_9_63_38]|nr:MAG: nucleotidyltransferase [Bacteroidetes bacterium SW_9_63_38]
MIAYLLCAGFGTRMRPLTDDTPKSLLPVSDRPLLDYLLAELQNWRALDAVHMAVNHRDADAFRHWAEGWTSTLGEDDVSLTIHDDGVASTDEQLGALGDLQFLLDETGVPSDGALVSGGDSLYRFPLVPLLNAFSGTDNQVLALHEPDVEQRRQSSILQLDGRRVTGLVEDPADADSARICPSFHLLTPAALAYVGSYLDSERDADTLGTFIHALSRWQIVTAIPLPEQPHLRLHCNTPDDLDRARALLADEPLLLDAETVQKCL